MEGKKVLPKFSGEFGNMAYVLVRMLSEPDRAFTKPELDELLKKWRPAVVKPELEQEVAEAKEELASLNKRYAEKLSPQACARAGKHYDDRQNVVERAIWEARYKHATEREKEAKKAVYAGGYDGVHLSNEAFAMSKLPHEPDTTANGYFRYVGMRGSAKLWVLTEKGRARAARYAEMCEV